MILQQDDAIILGFVRTRTKQRNEILKVIKHLELNSDISCEKTEHNYDIFRFRSGVLFHI